LGIAANDFGAHVEIHLANTRAKVLLGHIRASLSIGLELLSGREVCLLELDAIEDGCGARDEPVSVVVKSPFLSGGKSRVGSVSLPNHRGMRGDSKRQKSYEGGGFHD